MAVSDLVSVRGQVMEYTYIPTGIKGEMVRSGVDSNSPDDLALPVAISHMKI